MRFPRGEEERREAHRLVESLSADDGRLTRIGAIQLAPALEHAIFVALRQGALDGPEPPAILKGPTAVAAPYARLARAAAQAARAGGGSIRQEGGILVAVEAEIHGRLLAPVAQELSRTDGPAVHVVVTSQNQVTNPGAFASVRRLPDVLRLRWLPTLAAHAVRVQRALPGATQRWREIDPARAKVLRRFAVLALPRLALAAARLDSLVSSLHPRLLAAFNESGIWGRLVPAVAHAHGLPALDLPHAEAADPWGTMGVGYDVMAVYGPRAADVMGHAGVGSERIVQVGVARYDPLVRQYAQQYRNFSAEPRRVIFASAPAVVGALSMTPAVKADVVRAAVAATAAVAPAELIVKPHPTERDRVSEETLAELTIPDGVEVRIERARDLHDLLPEAWLLITGASQSVFEAAIVGIPSITVNTTGGPDPVTFAEEGIAIGATDGRSAAAAARDLLDPEHRRAAVMRARRALVARLGELDGHAVERTSRLIVELAAG
jgi:hypothetical protein